MIKLVVGLGNPGRQYEKTRHNAGFWFLDCLEKQAFSGWSVESRFQGLLSSVITSSGKIILLKPQTFMNRSGDAVGKVVRYFNIAPEEILVVHDELDFEVGAVKMKKGGGHAGHNGLRDIIAHLGVRDFFRLRLGIGRPQRADSKVADYVLSEPSISEQKAIDSAINAVLLNQELLLSASIDKFSNELNKSLTS